MDIGQILPKVKIAGGAPQYEYTENDQTFPAGMWRWRLQGDVMILERALATDWSSDRDTVKIESDGTITFAGKVVYGNATSLEIASDIITVTKSYHELVVASGTASGNDDLVTINGGSDGQILVLRSATTGGSDTVTVKTTGNIALEANADFALDDVRDTIMLIYDLGQTKWLEISRSSNT